MQTALTEYRNSFYNSKYQDSKPVIQTGATPIQYKDYFIYNRSKKVYDIVKDGVCIGMYNGLTGAKKAIDNGKLKFI